MKRSATVLIISLMTGVISIILFWVASGRTAMAEAIARGGPGFSVQAAAMGFTHNAWDTVSTVTVWLGLICLPVFLFSLVAFVQKLREL